MSVCFSSFDCLSGSEKERKSGFPGSVKAGLVLFLLFFCCIPSVLAQHSVISRGGSIWLGGEKMDLYLFKDDSFGLRVMDEGDSKTKLQYGGHEKAFKARRCIMGVNGGFFTKENNPLGLVVQNGKRLHTLETGSFAVAGVLFDNGKKVGLLRARDYLALPKEKRTAVREALQGGPFLVENGKPVKGLDGEKKASRTFAATNGKGLWCLGVTSSLTLKELAVWLADVKEMKGFTVKQALNLDGGSSSLFWLKSKGSLMEPIKPVRNYLGVAERKTAAGK